MKHEKNNYCFYGRGVNQLKAYNEQLRESEQKINQQKEAAKQSREYYRHRQTAAAGAR